MERRRAAADIKARRSTQVLSSAEQVLTSTRAAADRPFAKGVQGGSCQEVHDFRPAEPAAWGGGLHHQEHSGLCGARKRTHDAHVLNHFFNCYQHDTASDAVRSQNALPIHEPPFCFLTAMRQLRLTQLRHFEVVLPRVALACEFRGTRRKYVFMPG